MDLKKKTFLISLMADHRIGTVISVWMHAEERVCRLAGNYFDSNIDLKIIFTSLSYFKDNKYGAL